MGKVCRQQHSLKLLAAEDTMKRLCICEICSCGRHRCPHRPTALHRNGKNSSCVLTEYTEKYPTYGSCQPPASLKPKPVDLGDRGKMDGRTTFKSDYLPYNVTRRPGRQQAEYKPMPGKFDMGTTYKQDFNTYEVQPFVAARPKERAKAVAGKLDTVPTYTDDFKQWAICKRELTKPDLAYHPPLFKFGGTTTFQDDYIARSQAPRESFKPPGIPMRCEIPFDGVTSNQLSYVPHSLEMRYVKPAEVYKPSGQPLQDLTTNRRDFQGLPGTMSKSCKPDRAKVSSDVPFQGSTEFTERFKEWPVSLPHLHQPDQYVGPTEHMSTSTTSAADYVGHKVQPFVSAKPFFRPTKSTVPFQGSTTMRDDFQPWVTQRQGIIKKPEEMTRASGKLDSLTTFKAHYTPHLLQPNISFKPSNKPMRSEAPLEDETMYRSEFTPKQIIVCPASFPSPRGYVYEDSDESGHRFFRKVSPIEDAANRVSLQKAVAVQ
ncbi:stabilizer of axonemal microtubules 2 [Aplochiton taeniatus]